MGSSSGKFFFGDLFGGGSAGGMMCMHHKYCVLFVDTKHI
jgi:hypothetical protein